MNSQNSSDFYKREWQEWVWECFHNKTKFSASKNCQDNRKLLICNLMNPSYWNLRLIIFDLHRVLPALFLRADQTLWAQPWTLQLLWRYTHIDSYLKLLLPSSTSQSPCSDSSHSSSKHQILPPCHEIIHNPHSFSPTLSPFNQDNSPMKHHTVPFPPIMSLSSWKYSRKDVTQACFDGQLSFLYPTTFPEYSWSLV